MSDGKISDAVSIHCTKCTAEVRMCHEDHKEYAPEDLLTILTDAWNIRTEFPSASLSSEESVDWPALYAGYGVKFNSELHHRIAARFKINSADEREALVAVCRAAQTYREVTVWDSASDVAFKIKTLDEALAALPKGIL